MNLRVGLAQPAECPLRKFAAIHWGFIVPALTYLVRAVGANWEVSSRRWTARRVLHAGARWVTPAA